jgi:hypothetical protein
MRFSTTYSAKAATRRRRSTSAFARRTQVTAARGYGYARVGTTQADWNTATGGLLDNANTILLGPATGDWGTLTHFALFDAATGGHVLLHGALTHPKTIDSGDSARFASGEIDVALD